MLKTQYRLRKTKDIENVMKRGKGVYGGSIGLKALKNERKFTRFGFVVGTKVAKSAVRRNQVKRRLREAVRLHFQEIKSGYDVMVVARTGAAGLNYQELEKNLLQQLKKLRLI